MIRTFDLWWNSLPDRLKEKYEIGKKPRLSHVNYIWVSNLINNGPLELNPTVDELLDWVKSEQLNAKQK